MVWSTYRKALKSALCREAVSFRRKKTGLLAFPVLQCLPIPANAGAVAFCVANMFAGLQLRVSS